MHTWQCTLQTLKNTPDTTTVCQHYKQGQKHSQLLVLIVTHFLQLTV